MKTDTFQKIAEHDHSGSGNGKQIAAAGIAADAITGAKIRLDNDQYLKARNAADSANVNLIKLDSSDEIEIGNAINIKDSMLTIIDEGDATKEAVFSLGGATTAKKLTMISSHTDNRSLTFPDATDTLVGKATTDTMTNKTLTAPVITSLDIDDDEFLISDNGDGTKEVDFQLSGASTSTKTTIAISQTVARTVTLPDATDTLVGKATTDTFTNKTFDANGTGNSISNIENADIKAAAAIDASKIADGTVSSTEFQYINSLSSNAQTQISAKAAITMTTNGDILYYNSGRQRLAKGTDGQVLALASGIPAWDDAPAGIDSVSAKTTTYTATTSDDIIEVDTSGGAWTLTLYAASGNSGKRLTIIKTTSDTTLCTIDGNASETINGNTTTNVATQYETLELYCDGTNWKIVNRKSDTGWASFSMTIDAVTTAPTKGTIDFDQAYWRREGDSMLINWSYRHTTAGAAGSGAYLMTIPLSLTADSGKLEYGAGLDKGIIGSCQFGANENTGVAAMYNSTSFSFMGSNSSGANASWNSGNEALSGANIRGGCSVKFPITGWKGGNE